MPELSLLNCESDHFQQLCPDGSGEGQSIYENQYYGGFDITGVSIYTEIPPDTQGYPSQVPQTPTCLRCSRAFTDVPGC